MKRVSILITLLSAATFAFSQANSTAPAPQSGTAASGTATQAPAQPPAT